MRKARRIILKAFRANPQNPAASRACSHLLTHGSGLREMLVLTALKGSRWGIDEISRQDILDLVKRMKSRQFDVPGSKFAYSNTNFFLAGEIVKNVAKVSLSEYAQRNIFDLLGMTSTRIIDDYTESIDRAQGYKPIAGGFKEAAPPYKFSGPTNLLTTVEDLMKWDSYFDTQEPRGKEAIWRLMTEKHATESYGLGLFVLSAPDPSDVWHNGVTIGHRAMLYRGYFPIPKHEITVAILSNFEFEWRKTDEREIDELISMVNTAVLPFNDFVTPKAGLLPKAPNLYNPVNLNHFEGSYHSEEINADYKVILNGRTLTVVRPKRGAVTLRPTGENKFWVDEFDEFLPILRRVNFEFERDEIDSVSGFLLSSDIDPKRFSGFPFKKTS